MPYAAARTARRAVGSEPIGPPTGHPHSCGPSSDVDQLSERITTIPRNRALAVADSVSDPAGYYRNNVIGTLGTLDAMAAEGVKQFGAGYRRPR